MAKPWSPYVVRSGDYVERLAFDRGITVDDIWAHENNQKLGETRREVAAGDVIYLPELKTTAVDVAAGSTTRVDATQLPRLPGLCIEVRDDAGKLVAASAWPKFGEGGKELKSKAGPSIETVVGERMSFQVVILNKHGPTQYSADQIVWTVDEPRVGSYVQTEAKAERGPLTTNAPSIAFHWTDGGKRSMQVMVRVQNEVMFAYADFDVKAPTRVKIETETRSVVVGPRRDVDSSGPIYMSFGAETPGSAFEPGIHFSLTASGIPGHDGEVCGVQVISTEGERRLASGVTESLVTDASAMLGRGARPDESWLDKTLPYSEWEDLRGDALDSLVWTTSDTPGVALAAAPGGVSNVPPMERMICDDRFSMYVMFRSKRGGSIPVTIARVDWYWKGTTERDVNGWSAPRDAEWSANPAATFDKTLPEWGHHADMSANPPRPAWKPR